jgi:arabinofuranosyltransferase
MLDSPAGSPHTVRTLGLAFFGILLLRTAWLSDAAYLTLRTVEHAATGFGLRWNVADRVQVYDHPLWLAVLAGGRLLSGETYFTTLAISIAASLIALWILLRHATADLTAVVVVAAAALSPLFLAFSTSGLESPLVHLLAAAFAAAALARRSPALLSAIGGLLVLTHWTTVFLVVPILAPLAMSSGRQARRLIVLAAFPALVWHAAAWWYYGTIGPNGWIAARTEGVAWADRLRNGLSFFAETTQSDPLFAAVLLMGLVFGLAMGGVAARLALGSALAMGWAVLSGGSVMAGRHLSVSFVVGLALAVRYLPGAGLKSGLMALAGVLVYASLAPVATVTSGVEYGRDYLPTARPHDPRAEDYQATGLLLESRPRRAPSGPGIAAALESAPPGQAVAVSRHIGMIGFSAGPERYVLDRQGRTDPLLARLPPAVGLRGRWSAERRLPGGYLERLPDGAPADASLEQLTGDIRAVTRGSLVSFDRPGALFRLPRRTPDLVAASSYGLRAMPLTRLAAEVATVPEGGIQVTLQAPRRIARVTARLTVGYAYRVDVMNGSDVVATVETPPVAWGVEAEASRELMLPSVVTGTALQVRCGDGIGRCALGEVRLDD